MRVPSGSSAQIFLCVLLSGALCVSADSCDFAADLSGSCVVDGNGVLSLKDGGGTERCGPNSGIGGLACTVVGFSGTLHLSLLPSTVTELSIIEGSVFVDVQPTKFPRNLLILRLQRNTSIGDRLGGRWLSPNFFTAMYAGRNSIILRHLHIVESDMTYGLDLRRLPQTLQLLNVSGSPSVYLLDTCPNSTAISRTYQFDIHRGPANAPTTGNQLALPCANPACPSGVPDFVVDIPDAKLCTNNIEYATRMWSAALQTSSWNYSMYLNDLVGKLVNGSEWGNLCTSDGTRCSFETAGDVLNVSGSIDFAMLPPNTTHAIFSALGQRLNGSLNDLRYLPRGLIEFTVVGTNATGNIKVADLTNLPSNLTTFDVRDNNLTGALDFASLVRKREQTAPHASDLAISIRGNLLSGAFVECRPPTDARLTFEGNTYTGRSGCCKEVNASETAVIQDLVGEGCITRSLLNQPPTSTSQHPEHRCTFSGKRVISVEFEPLFTLPLSARLPYWLIVDANSNYVHVFFPNNNSIESERLSQFPSDSPITDVPLFTPDSKPAFIRPDKVLRFNITDADMLARPFSIYVWKAYSGVGKAATYAHGAGHLLVAIESCVQVAGEGSSYVLAGDCSQSAAETVDGKGLAARFNSITHMTSVKDAVYVVDRKSIRAIRNLQNGPIAVITLASPSGFDTASAIGPVSMDAGKSDMFRIWIATSNRLVMFDPVFNSSLVGNLGGTKTPSLSTPTPLHEIRFNSISDITFSFQINEKVVVTDRGKRELIEIGCFHSQQYFDCIGGGDSPTFNVTRITNNEKITAWSFKYPLTFYMIANTFLMKASFGVDGMVRESDFIGLPRRFSTEAVLAVHQTAPLSSPTITVYSTMMNKTFTKSLVSAVFQQQTKATTSVLEGLVALLSLITSLATGRTSCP